MLRRLFTALLTVLLAVPAVAGGGPSETIVLVNRRSDDSRRVAEHYVRARSIPPTNVCRVDCDPSLTIKREDFVRDVVDPLRTFLRRGGLEDRARFIVLTQGMPIRADGRGGAVSTAAMLELLDTSVCGADGNRMPRFRNPYTNGPASKAPGLDGGRLYLVTALISSTADEAIALIDRSVASDGTAPAKAHFVYQDANGAAGNRNPQYDAARTAIEAAGHTTEHVKSGVDVVVDRERVMGYMSGGAYSKLSPENVKKSEYLPGAICDMLQSYGSVPENFGPDGKGGRQFPVTHMVRAGVTGVHGTVAEPYNVAFPSADLFGPYVQGYTLAETFHQKLPFRYWMNLVMGDPLCAPYAERTDFELGISIDKDWSRSGTIGVSAPGAVRIEAFIDGVALGSADGDDAPFAVDGRDHRSQPAQLLVEVTWPGVHEPKSWKTATLDFADSGESRPIRRPGRLPFGGSLQIPLSEKPKGFAVLFMTPETGLPHSVEETDDGLRLTFDWSGAKALAGKTADLTLTLGDEEFEWPVAIGPARLEVKSETTLIAGASTEIRVMALGAGDQPAATWGAHVELRSASPPVRWARTRLGPDGSATLRFATPRTGTYTLEVVEPESGLSQTLRIDVGPSVPHHATTPSSRVPLGQVNDIEIRIEDQFGNLTPGPERTLTVTFPDDPHARVPEKVHIAEGSARGTLRDFVVTRPRRHRLVITDASGKTLSQPGETVNASAGSVRAWLSTRGYRGAEGESLFGGDPGAGVAVDGGVSGGRLFRRVRDPDGAITAPGSRVDDVSCAVAFVQALADTKATLRMSASGRTRVILDGATIFDGVPETRNEKHDGKDAADLDLTRGVHRITVVTQGVKRRPTFRLCLAEGKLAMASALRVVADAGVPPTTPCVSGRVLRAGGGVIPGGDVVLTDASGAEHAVKSGDDGSWFVVGASVGPAVVRLTSAAGLAGPMERATEVQAGTHTTDVDFHVADRAPPSVSVPAPPERAGRTLRVVATVADSGGVAEVRLTVGDTPVGNALARAPWVLTADVSGLPRGPLEVVVVARDRAGNEGRSDPVTVELVNDAKGPTLSLKGLSRNASLKKPTTISARVSDPIGVQAVEFLLDGSALGAPRSTAPYEVSLDPASIEPGRHLLTCVARDTDGNETRKELPFRVK